MTNNSISTDLCFFTSDLHGCTGRYQKLFDAILKEKPSAVFLGGDLLPSGLSALTSNDSLPEDFINGFLVPAFMEIKSNLGKAYPRVFLILGNDDGWYSEEEILNAESKGIWEYINEKRTAFGKFEIIGYAYVPPTPFLLKDWERYDVSRFVDPGCIPPEEGWRSNPVAKNIIAHATIQEDLARLTQNIDLSKSILLFHTPPYQTRLDRAQLDGKLVDHVPVDVHVGSIAVKRLIETRNPLITLHGHIHESARITGSWRENIGLTQSFSGAHDGPELALIRFNPDFPDKASRELI
ncbi:MAG: metallophosphoesterase [Anaerolineaceae bacterium]|nr:metallophosphoesterase [Anaerolineaceae bacterium]